MIKHWQLRKTQNELKTTLLVAHGCSDLCCPLCAVVSSWTCQWLCIRSVTFSLHNAQQTLYFSNPCSSTKYQVSDLTNLVSKPSLVLPQINTPLHLTRQAPGLHCLTPVSQWPAGKILRSGDSGPVWGEGGRTGMCVCDLGKSRWSNRWKPLWGATSIGSICKSLFEPIALCRGWGASSTDHATSGSEGSRHLSGSSDVGDCRLSHCTRNKMNRFMCQRIEHLPAPPQIRTGTSPDIRERSRETWNCFPRHSCEKCVPAEG